MLLLPKAFNMLSAWDSTQVFSLKLHEQIELYCYKFHTNACTQCIPSKMNKKRVDRFRFSDGFQSYMEHELRKTKNVNLHIHLGRRKQNWYSWIMYTGLKKMYKQFYMYFKGRTNIHVNANNVIFSGIKISNWNASIELLAECKLYWTVSARLKWQ